MNQENGYSLIEVIISTALSILIVMSITEFSQQTKFKIDRANSEMALKNDFDIQINKFANYVTNAVRLEPAENYNSNAGIKLYRGILGLGNDIHHKKQFKKLDCVYDETNTNDSYSILRMTSLHKNFIPRRLLRPWGETSAGKTGQNHELRISSETDSIENFPDRIKEIVIFDIDGTFVRRYQVKKINKILNSINNPYTNLPQKNSDGQNILYNYTTLELNMPFDAKGELQSPLKEVNFIVNSLIYFSATEYLCVQNTKKSILKFPEYVLFDQSTEEKFSSFLDINESDTSIKSLDFKFAVTRGSAQHVDADNTSLFTNFFSATNWNNTEKRSLILNGCVNSMSVDLDLEFKQEEKTKIQKMNRTLFLSNFDKYRPAECLD